MNLSTKQVVIGSLGFLFLLSLVFVQYEEVTRRRVEAGIGRDLWVVGEDFSGDPGRLARSLEATGVDAVYDFPLRYALVDVYCKGAPVSRLAGTLSLDALYPDPDGQLLTFLDNHDLPRIASECAEGGRGPEELHQALAPIDRWADRWATPA